VQLPAVAGELGAGRIGVEGSSLAVGVGSQVAGVRIGAVGEDRLRIEELGGIEAGLGSLYFRFQWVGIEVVRAVQGSLGLQLELPVVVQQAGLLEEESHHRAVGLAGVAEVELLVEKLDCMQRMLVVDLAGVVEPGMLEEEWDCMEYRLVVEQAAEVAVERTGWCQKGKQRPRCLPHRQSLHQLELEQL
jgi:hypothetical protein